LPSKVFRIMACGRPILALCDPRSDLAGIVNHVGAGKVCAPQDTAAIAQAIAAVKSERTLATEMGERGRDYVAERLARDVVTRRYADLFATVAGERPRA
jgi:colanic acid biosynthesis glycosyl transferase WcaI